MEIIFECKREKEEFFQDECPNMFGLKEHKNCGNGSGVRSHCLECWEQSGLKYEIKNNQSVPEQTCLNLNDIIKVKFTDYGKDIYYHQWHDLLMQNVTISISREYPKVDDEGYTDIQLWRFMSIFGKHIKFGMIEQIIEDNNIYIPKESIKMTDKTPKEITYTDCVYELIKEECEGLDSIYEDYIVKLVGNCGLAALKRANLIEACGVINCRQLYALCEKE